MTVSVLSENINIVMNQCVNREAASKPDLGIGSSLQNPDISRVQLSAILRQRTTEGAKKAAKFFWSSFGNIYEGNSANTNK